MSIQIINSDGRKKRKIAGKYLQEIRDAREAGFTRRDLLKMGLVAGGSGLAAVYSIRKFKPFWARAEEIKVTSPTNTPFMDPLPIPPLVEETILTPPPTKGTNPDPSNYKGFHEAARPDHQKWEEFLPVKRYELIEKRALHNFYPAVDGVPPSPIWTFVDRTNNNVGPLRINAYYGDPIIVRIHNDLPPNLADNDGFGIPQTSTHLHNGHTASESDGGPTHFYDAGFFKDYHYANVRAGFASTHPTTGDVRETMSFLWFHDHRHGFTSRNVYKGLASFYTLFSDDINLDTGNETTGLRLPSGEFDIPMIFVDRTFEPDGRLFFEPLDIDDGFLGDKYTVNGKIQPFLEVKRRRYRFRLLDGGPSRVYEFFLSNGQPFIQLSNDGNLLPKTLSRTSIRLGVAERVDVIVDFSNAKIGEKIYLQNRLEQTTGRGPTGKIIAPTNIVELRVIGDAPDNSLAIAAGTPLLPLPDRPPTVQSRQWEFQRSGGRWLINGELFDEHIIRARPVQNTAELWTLKAGGGWLHPIHIHLEEFQLLNRDDKPVPVDEVARKDVVRIGDSAVGTQNTGKVALFIQFRDWLGDYPLHCHNTVHEDHAMMLRWEVVPQTT